MPNYSTVQSHACNYNWVKWLKLRYEWITIIGLDSRKQLIPPLVLLKNFANIEQVEADLTGNFLNKTVRCIITATDPNHMSSCACNRRRSCHHNCNFCNLAWKNTQYLWAISLMNYWQTMQARKWLDMLCALRTSLHVYSNISGIWNHIRNHIPIIYGCI